MSDNYLRYVPVSPTFQPERTAAEAAQKLLTEFLPQAEEIDFELLEDVEFIDAGSNWSGVRCPLCNADAEGWWGDAMSTAAESRFTNLNVRTPCCDGNTSLDKLNYQWPVAFGRFVLEAGNPNSTGLSAAQLQKLSVVLGSPLREVAAHV